MACLLLVLSNMMFGLSQVAVGNAGGRERWSGWGGEGCGGRGREEGIKGCETRGMRVFKASLDPASMRARCVLCAVSWCGDVGALCDASVWLSSHSLAWLLWFFSWVGG